MTGGILLIMLTEKEYIRHSIETNLFFLRIMKEHLIFASCALMPKDAGMINSFIQANEKFEKLLLETVSLAKGIISTNNMAAGDIVTEYTLNAEMVTKQLTGLPINTNITLMEARLINDMEIASNVARAQTINSLNQRIINLLKPSIQTQKTMLENVIACKLFTAIYPLMLDHVIREAEHYLGHLERLQKRESMVDQPSKVAEHEEFWNDIMGEHAEFIRGLLDPTEEELIRSANGFANEFDELTVAASQAFEELSQLAQVTRNSIITTTNIRNFKEQGTKGILDCKIRSIILPLLSDHVLREANHYLKSLKMLNM